MSQLRKTENHKNITYYREAFSDIKVYINNNKSGKALNQPILILSVIDLITQGFIKDRYILISDELIDTFKKYWEVLGSGSYQGSDFALPFFHLKNQKGKFWHLKFSSKYDGGRPQSIPKLKHDIDYDVLDDELFSLLQEQNSRKDLIDALVSAWFSSDENKIEDVIDINLKFEDASLETENTTESEKENIQTSPKWSLRKSLIREAFFRKQVVHIYDYRCAFCGLKVKNSINQTIVDGAHIKPFSEFYDNSINNGISFCKNHHWAFDRSWFTVDKQYRIIVSEDLEEESPHTKPMKDFHGEKLILPKSEEHFPEQEALEWHRQKFEG